MNYEGVSIVKSHGACRNGKLAAFVRPDNKSCFQRSRRVTAYTQDELLVKISQAVKRWYSPMNYYLVDGRLIGSNNERNALKEYWKVCELGKMNKEFKVVPIDNIKQPHNDTGTTTTAEG